MDTMMLVRQQLAGALGWEDAHVSFDDAVANLPHGLRGIRPEGFPHSAWELLEHLRITQDDILAFCQTGDYRELRWPEEYWPPSPEPLTPAAWSESVSAFRNGRAALQRIALDPEVELTSVVPHGTDQSYLRELLLAADHNSYHLGQLILVRRALGAWPAR